MKRLPTLTLIATVTLWTQIASAGIITWKVDRETRLAILYAPSTTAGEKAPLVFSFPGHGDDILGRETVRKLVKDDPGVIKIRMGRKKAHTIYSIPESAARRIHTRLLNAA